MLSSRFIRPIALFAAIFTATAVHAEIHEVSSMREVLPWIQGKTIVVFDLDNTVMEASQTLGSDQFFEHLMRKAKERGLEGDRALAWSLERASQVQPITSVKPVEESTPAIIRMLQSRGIPTVALTARPIAWAQGTLGQLHSVGVNFTHSILYRGDSDFGPDGRGRNIRGVLFMPRGGDKGTYLKSFIEESGLAAERVLFIDDKVRNVESVDRAFVSGEIKDFEFRYGAADFKVESFDGALADFEWTYFMRTGVFLSDSEARSRM